jgi:hypothetical protein
MDNFIVHTHFKGFIILLSYFVKGGDFANKQY